MQYFISKGQNYVRCSDWKNLDFSVETQRQMKPNNSHNDRLRDSFDNSDIRQSSFSNGFCIAGFPQLPTSN